MKHRQIAKMLEHEAKSCIPMKEEIATRYGDKAISEARTYLCPDCKHEKCGFLPITTNGEECPYAPRENRKGTEFNPV